MTLTRLLHWTDVPPIDWRGLCAAPGHPGDPANYRRCSVRCNRCGYHSELRPVEAGFVCSMCDGRER